jgi:hypothetical protein
MKKNKDQFGDRMKMLRFYSFFHNLFSYFSIKESVQDHISFDLFH